MGFRLRWYFGRINKALRSHRLLLERFSDAQLEGKDADAQLDELIHEAIRLERRLQRLCDEGERLSVLGLANQNVRRAQRTMETSIGSWQQVVNALEERRGQSAAA
ncbi:MAG: hypothetical protein JO247_21775 [Chloroflexi bacterium]|nr:hypothetical protein [Chloroflexota bacterium]